MKLYLKARTAAGTLPTTFLALIVALLLSSSPGARAQTTNFCDGCTFSENFTNPENTVVLISGYPLITNDGIAPVFDNAGLVVQTDQSDLEMDGSAVFNNLFGGIFELQGRATVGATGDGWIRPVFNNYGLLRKTGPTNSDAFIQAAIPFNNLGGTVEVESGTLTLVGPGFSSNGLFSVAEEASLYFMNTWSGTLKGTGNGQAFLWVVFTGAPSVTLDFQEGRLQISDETEILGNVTNIGSATISGSPSVGTDGAIHSTFYNEGLVKETNGTLTIHDGDAFVNLPGATFDIQTDDGVGNGSGSFTNQGLFRKSGGGGRSLVNRPVNFRNEGGTIEVDTGSISFAQDNFYQGGGPLVFGVSDPYFIENGELLAYNVYLDGPVVLKFLDSFIPSPGMSFQIISASSITGTFSTASLPRGVSVQYSSNAVYLVVTNQITLPVQITTPRVSNGAIAFSFATLPNTAYVVEQCTSLPGTNWTACTNFTANGSPFQFSKPLVSGPVFFRVREP